MALISGRMTCSSFYVISFPIGPLLGVPSYSVGGEVIGSWKNIYLYHEKLVASFRLVKLPIEKGSIRVNGHPDTWEHRERRHPG